MGVQNDAIFPPADARDFTAPDILKYDEEEQVKEEEVVWAATETAEGKERTPYNNTVIEKTEHKLPDMPEFYRSAVVTLAEAFRTIGAQDWAISGSMQKIITGVQEAGDLPGDIDVVTTVPAVEHLWELHQKGELRFPGNVTIEEPKPLKGGEKYGKSKMLQIEITNDAGETLEMEIFGEGGDPNETVNSYGGSVQLGNPNRNAEIWKVEGGVQILSEHDQRRQYALVLCNELTREAGGSHEKLASRIVSLLQYAEKDPDMILRDLEVIQNEYKNLPEHLLNMVANVRTIISNREILKSTSPEQKIESEAQLSAAQVDTLIAEGRRILGTDSFETNAILDFLREAARIDLSQSGSDYKKLREVYQLLSDVTTHVVEHGSFEDRKALVKALDMLYQSNEQSRNMYILFLETKVKMRQAQDERAQA